MMKRPARAALVPPAAFIVILVAVVGTGVRMVVSVLI